VVGPLRVDEAEGRLDPDGFVVSDAKKAAAFFRISRSARSTRFSRSSCRNRSRSSLESGPLAASAAGRAAAASSICACRRQCRSVCADTPSSAANSFGVRSPACSNRNACSRNSAGYGGLVFGMDSLPEATPPMVRCPRNRGNSNVLGSYS
jgi:hypothetical protein